MEFRTLLVAAILALASGFAAAQEQAFTNRSTELKDKASPDGKTLATIPENTGVKVLQRSGAWTRVEATGQSGFVRAFHLRFGATVESSSSGGSLLGGLFGQRQQNTASMATTGIRGLSAEDFKNANPDTVALGRMQSYRADNASAERFAREAKLATVSINYLMEEATSSRGRR